MIDPGESRTTYRNATNDPDRYVVDAFVVGNGEAVLAVRTVRKFLEAIYRRVRRDRRGIVVFNYLMLVSVFSAISAVNN